MLDIKKKRTDLLLNSKTKNRNTNKKVKSSNNDMDSDGMDVISVTNEPENLLKPQTNCYSSQCQFLGPYFVLLRKTETSINLKSKLDIARILTRAEIKFLDILTSKKDTWKVIFESREMANKCLSCQLGNCGLESYIPKTIFIRKGVIYGVPLDMSIDEIRLALEKDNDVPEIGNIYRLKKRNSETLTWLESTTICIEFHSQTLPNQVKIMGLLMKMTAYVPVTRICYKCGGLNHISTYCNKEEKCLTCGESHTKEKGKRCEKEQKCINCGGRHSVFYKNCPKRRKADNITQIMARENVSYYDAKNVINPSNVTKFKRDTEKLDYDKQFPNLQNKGNREKSIYPSVSVPDSNPLPWVEVMKNGKKKVVTQSSQSSGTVNSSSANTQHLYNGNNDSPDIIVSSLFEIVKVLNSVPNVELLLQRIRRTITLHCDLYGQSK